MTLPLAGQWIGKISGTNSGTATLNVDSDRDQRGLLLVTDDDPGMVAVVVDIGWKPAGALTDIKFFSHDIRACEKREGVSIPNRVEAIASIHGRHLEGEWSTDIPTGGKLSLELQDEKNPSAADYTFNHWADFEQWVKDRQREESHLIYRGHASNQFRLETSFHRTGRRDQRCTRRTGRAPAGA